MRFAHIYIVFCLLVLGNALMAQTRISGTVTDAETGKPLPGASVQVSGKPIGAITDDNGEFRLEIVGASAVLRVQYLGYEPRVERVFPAKQQRYDIALTPQNLTLETTTITAQKLQTVYPDRKTMVIDYEFLKDDILVIVYDRIRKRNILQLLSDDFTILSEYDNAAEPPRALFKDCLGADHCISAHFAGQVDIGFQNQLIVRSDSLHLFQQHVEPCLASLDSTFYYAAMPNDYTMKFTYINGTDKRKQPLYACVDKASIERVRDEANMEAVDAADFLDPRRAAYRTELNRRYLKTVICPPIYVPIVVIRGAICVFDHPNRRLIRFDLDGRIKEDAPLAYTSVPDWRREVFVNAAEDDAFTLTERNGIVTVHRIDLSTGTLAEHWELPFQFVQKIQVRGQYIYFSYRDNREDQVKRLYRLEM